MAWQLLPVNYTDAVWEGLRKYNEINNADGTVSFSDVTVYSQKENSFFGAKDANRMNEALNTIMSMVENGTNLYEAFQNYFAAQKVLFENKSDSEFDDFKKYLSDLEDEGFTSLTEIANQAKASATAAKTSEDNAKVSETNAATSATAAKTSETEAKSAKDSSETAKTAAETAQTAAETAANNARGYANEGSNILLRNEQVAVRTPYVGTNGNWYVWNNNTTSYEDSGTKAQGDQGIQGVKGEKGEQGDQGLNGVAVAAEGVFAFNIDENGHLILSYTDEQPPNFTVNEEGHLIYTF